MQFIEQFIRRGEIMSWKILVVEDEVTTLKLIKIVLQREGYQIVTATSGSEGLRKAQEFKPDHMILDIVLPGMDGFQVCQYLRREPETAEMPVIMFSGLDRPSEQQRAFEAGGDDYLTKPVKMADLLEKVRAALYFKN
jgi:two-component system, cell cycle response regulator